MYRGGRASHMFKNNLTFGYVLFVGIPLPILIGSLRAGGHLTALPALSGEWIVEPAQHGAQPDNCAGPLAKADFPALSIYQTGTDLPISFNDPMKVTLRGKLEHGRILGIGTRVAAPANCGNRAAIRLEAGIAGTFDQRSLLGRISFDGCASCAPVAFVATRPALRAGR
jgi:hypothetical protein